MIREGVAKLAQSIDARALKDVEVIRVANLLSQLCGMPIDVEDEALIVAFSVEADRLERARCELCARLGRAHAGPCSNSVMGRSP